MVQGLRLRIATKSSGAYMHKRISPFLYSPGMLSMLKNLVKNCVVLVFASSNMQPAQGWGCFQSRTLTPKPFVSQETVSLPEPWHFKANVGLRTASQESCCHPGSPSPFIIWEHSSIYDRMPAQSREAKTIPELCI